MNTMINRNSQPNKGKSKLLRGILIGAAAGAVISLFDKATRESVMECSRKGFVKTKDAIQNPGQVIEGIRDRSEHIIDTMESISEDVTYIASKIQEFKEIPLQVSSAVMETKEALTSSGGEKNKE